MAQFKIESALFGTLDISAEDGLMEDYTILIDSGEIDLTLSIEEDILDDTSVLTVQCMLDQIPQMYKQVKKFLTENMKTNEIIRYFIQCQIDELAELDELFDVDSNDQITFELFVENMSPRMISIARNRDDIIDCTFDFSLPEDYSDELLVFCFNDKYELYNLTHES